MTGAGGKQCMPVVYVHLHPSSNPRTAANHRILVDWGQSCHCGLLQLENPV